MLVLSRGPIQRRGTEQGYNLSNTFAIPLGTLNMIGVIVNMSSSSSAPPTPTKQASRTALGPSAFPSSGRH